MKNIKKNTAALCVVMLILIGTAGGVLALDESGTVPGTDIKFSGFAVSKNGISVRFVNASGSDLKISLQVLFYDRNGNKIGHSIFGLREMPEGASVDYSDNYLTGNWKECKAAQRMEWQKMTYEYIY
jgi:hypothetical protein